VSVAKSGSQLVGKRFADDEEFETEVRKWLRQQSKHFYAAGFDAPVKRRDKCIDVGGGYVENKYLFQVRISHVLRFTSIRDLLTDCPSELLWILKIPSPTVWGTEKTSTE
jgi:hypothetical protein